ncbi:TetR family transcriptional regulator [Kutzneria viridogrisea]|uniref:HTH tetR-type domain-containing protein n=2 Tax=Kutzneria TaxID=43356 RepID=W5W063_9PSEU|nr:TetR family transcriptional regulator [Kutzneria albida]AHH93951.1 hypothetical protein KALB_575 [Kutzneria albida DSM 43870]MBA8931044.1 AcrR family transcriptional regulator [Kutzneria viridogrisea]
MSQVTSFADRVRASLREQLLAATAELLAERGFRGLRMADVAAATGVSRQTVYNEFGGKDELVAAVARHKTAEFVDGIAARLTAAGGLLAGIECAIDYALRHATEDRLVNSILTGTDAEDLLPLLTTRALPVLLPLVEQLSAHLLAHRPGLPPEQALLYAETGVRLTVSHLLMPTGDPALAASTITDLMRRLLREDNSS